MATPFERLEGKYEILSKIREGGMGSVYKVRHRLLDEVRVIKVMRPHLASDEVLRARFLREAKVAIKLHHPNVAQIYDFTIDESDYAYLVMEFIDGFNLQEVVKVLDRPPLGMVLEIAHQGLLALGYLHRKRMIHRDVSPDNLLVTRDEDGRLLVKLIDLGIVKVHHEGDDALTSAGTFLGKVRYSSPEHFRTHEGAEISEASDLYSFGVLLYEMLTTVYPIKGSSVASLISGHLMHEPVGFDSSDPDGHVPEELRAVILKTLEKDPANRHPSARHLRDALEPLRKQFPIEEKSLEALFDVPNITTRKIATVKPGSSQSRIEETFRAATTPARGGATMNETDYESSGTIETPKTPASGTDASREALKPQLRALLLGADKLLENKHFDEARLQLDSVLELDSDNTEATRLLEVLEKADLKTRQRREKAADAIRKVIEREDFEGAAGELARAVESLGAAEIFKQVEDEIARAREAAEQRRQRLREIESEAAELVAKEDFEGAVALLEEGLGIDPSHAAIKDKLDAARDDLQRQIETRRRRQEIEAAADRIRQHIDNGEDGEAERALELGIKLYGEERIFTDLRTRLEELRHKRRLDRAAELRTAARSLIEQEDFSDALDVLRQAHDLAPEVEEADELMAVARDGVREQEEAARRRAVAEEAERKIDRLVRAGRLRSAAAILDATVDEIGAFDREQALRDRLGVEAARRDEIQAQAREVLDSALDHAAGDDFTRANEELDQARRIVEGHPELGEWVREAEAEINRRLEAHRRAMALDNVLSSVEGQIEKNALEEARRELGVATRLYGTTDVLAELEARIAARERVLRRERVDALIDRAKGKKRTTEEAIEGLEAALAIDPGNEAAQRLLVESRAAQRRELDDELEQQHLATLDEIDYLIANGDTGRAIRNLEALISEAGDFRAARWLRDRLERDS